MSHYYHVGCKRCGADSDSSNHAEAEMILAVKESYPLFLLSKTRWDWSNVENSDIFQNGSLARFIVQHFACGQFFVKGEYRDDPEVPVQVDAPEVKAIILESAIVEARALRDRLDMMIREDMG